MGDGWWRGNVLLTNDMSSTHGRNVPNFEFKIAKYPKKGRPQNAMMNLTDAMYAMNMARK